MKDFDYAVAQSVEEAVALLAAPGKKTKALAGGTDIIVQLREGNRDADLVVDLKKIPELMTFDFEPAKGLKLGASVPCYKIYEDPRIASAYPALADSAHIVGGWQIQSRASIGGNLCNSSPAADTIPSLIAHDAKCHIAGPAGRRTVSAAEFCTAPGRNVLQPGELLVSLEFPPVAPKTSSAYLRFIPRNEMDIAVVGAASWVKLSPDGKTIEQARIALGAVAPTPVMAIDASNFLAGKAAEEATYIEAGKLARQVAKPITDMRGTVEFRVHLAGLLTQRTLALAVQRARESN